MRRLYMTPEEAKQHLHNLLGQRLSFNKDFGRYFSLLKETMQQDLLNWCKDCKDDVFKGSSPKNPSYKDRWVFLRKIGNGVRCALVKIKNSESKKSDHHKSIDWWYAR